MKKKELLNSQKNFFANIKPCKKKSTSKEKDKPFEWSENVLNGKSEINIISPFNKSVN